MRFQVPQFVDIKDKIIGPLTLKQFMYYVVAGLALVPVYMLVDLSLFITLAIPVLAMAVLFAHVRLAGQAFGAVLMSAFGYYAGERLYLWRRVDKVSIMKVEGEEYGGGLPDDDRLQVSSLRAIEQTLITQGNVIAQDAQDPMLAEGEGDADDDKNSSGGRGPSEMK